MNKIIMKNLKIAVMLFVSFVAVNSAHAQKMFSTLTQASEDFIDNIMQGVIDDSLVDMVSIGVIKNGKIVYLRGYGSEFRNNTIVGADACTNYRIGSVSKFITSTLAMMLIEEGLLDLNADVRQYVPEYPDKGPTVRIRHLLSHHAGLQDGGAPNNAYFANNNFFDPVNAVNEFKDMPLLNGYPTENKEMGSYSNYGFDLLTAAIERAGGAPFEQLVYERITKRYKMPYLSAEYKWEGPNYINKNATNGDLLHHLGSGGFVASVIDLALLAKAYVNQDVFENHNMFTAVMAQPRSKLLNRNNFIPTNNPQPRVYGYGLLINTFNLGINPQTFYGHSGASPGGASSLFFLPEYSQGGGFTTSAKDAVVIISDRGMLELENFTILQNIKNLSVKSTTDFIPNDPDVATNASYHGNLPTFHGESITMSNPVPEFFDYMSYAANEVELGDGFEVSADIDFEVRLVNQNRDCPNNTVITLPKVEIGAREAASNEGETVIENNLGSITFSVFPNPTSGRIQVYVPDPESARIEVYSSQGIMIRKIEAPSAINELSLEQEPAGLYIVNLIRSDGTKEYLKFIKK